MNIVTMILIAIMLVFVVGMFIKSTIELIIYSNNKWYCKYRLKDEWNRWKYIQDHINNIKFIKVDDKIKFIKVDYYYYDETLYCNFKFEIDDVNQKLFDDNEFYINLNCNTGLCAVFSKDDCILSTFDEYNSKKTAMLLCDILKKEYHIKNIEHSLLKKLLVKETNNLQEYYQDIADLKRIISFGIRRVNKNKSFMAELLVYNDSLNDEQKAQLETLTELTNEIKENVQETNTVLVKYRKLVQDTEKNIQCLKSRMKQKQRTFKTK